LRRLCIRPTVVVVAVVLVVVGILTVTKEDNAKINVTLVSFAGNLRKLLILKVDQNQLVCLTNTIGK